MYKDDIYDHLAQVYLGKRKTVEAEKKKQVNAWLLINILITGVIFASVFYGFTAFLKQHTPTLQNNILFSVHSGTIRMSYNFKDSFNPVETFALSLPEVDISKYRRLHFTVRAKEEGSPGVLKIVLRNDLNETDSYYIKGIDLNWKEVDIPLSDFENISDFSSIQDFSFILESWNVDNQKGLILIEDVSLAGVENSS